MFYTLLIMSLFIIYLLLFVLSLGDEIKDLYNAVVHLKEYAHVNVNTNTGKHLITYLADKLYSCFASIFNILPLTVTRFHIMRLLRPHTNYKSTDQTFIVRVVSIWNSLLLDLIYSRSSRAYRLSLLPRVASHP